METTLKEKTNKDILSFEDFNTLIQKRFDEIQSKYLLFKSSVSGDTLWDLYLKSFRKGDNPVFRDPNSSFHNCNNDKNFIRRYGNVVGIDENYNLVNMFDLVIPNESIYYEPAKALSTLLNKSAVGEVFFETYNELNLLPYEKTNKNLPKYQLGNSRSFKQYTPDEVTKFGVVTSERIYEFSHYHVFLNRNFVKFGNDSIESIRADYREPKQVFKRGLDEISLDTLELVRDLINQGSLLNGDSYLPKLIEFIKFKKEYNNLGTKYRDNYTWVKSYDLKFAKFRNELIGTLCVELTEGKELNKACLDWNKRADPVNYMKAKSPITKKQIEEAKKFVEENGYEDSFDRRFATIDDISIDEILHSNVGDNKIKNASIFDSVKPSKSTQHKRSELENVEEVTIEKFMKDILPNSTSIEVYMENRFESNLVSLITSKNKNVKNIFKWSNPFSWTYNGNLAGKSMIKENVKAVGGKTTGAFRCSLQWNDEDTKGIIDLDLHCTIGRTEVDYSNKRDSQSTTWLDVDMINPSGVGIENITIDKLVKDGAYKLRVKNFSGHHNFKGFKAEIEYDGNTFEYSFLQPFSDFKDIATITVKSGVITNIEHHLPESSSNKEFWNLETNSFHKVNLVCQSPNYWGDNNIGNKHYFFMLDNCKTDVSLRSFHNEYLNSDLLDHRKVMEVLGTQSMIEPSKKQLSGLGFNSTVRDEVIVKVSGSFKRTLKIKF